MTRGAPALAPHAAACAHHAAASCRVRSEQPRRSAPLHARYSPQRRAAQSLALPAAATGRHAVCTGSLEDIPDSEPMDASTSPADIAVSVPPQRDSGLPQRKKFQVRIRITPAQQVGLDEFWKAQVRSRSARATRQPAHSPLALQGVKKKEHRTRLVALAGGVLLFRSPVMIVGASGRWASRTLAR